MTKVHTILYVDDSKANLLLFKTYYEKFYHVITALNGYEGLEIVKKEKLSLIISDQAMPGISGVEFLEKVLDINPKPNRILLTAFEDLQALAEAVNRGKIYQYVNKPFNKTKLKNIIDGAINEFLLREENEQLTLNLKDKTDQLHKKLDLEAELNKKLEKSFQQIETEQKKLNDILELSPIPMMVIDMNNQVHILNKMFTQVFGYNRKEICTFSDWLTLAYPNEKNRKHFLSFWDNNNLSNIPELYYEDIVYGKDGNPKTIQIKFSEIEQNKIIVFNDLTKLRSLEKDIEYRVNLEKDLREAKYKAEQANKIKSDFIASMSHEIRTPLNSIIGFSDMLEQDLKDHASIDYIKTIQSASNTLLSLINDILDFSKIEAGKTTINKEPVCFRKLVEEVYNVFKFKAQQKRLDFILENEQDYNYMLVIDSLRIKQILMNLINNALKFTKKGFVKIVILYENKGATKLDVKIKIEDTGIGIPDDALKRIFNTFEQVDKTDDRKFEGTGLGLAIAQNLASLMNGKIFLESELNKGSTFTLLLREIKISKKLKNTEKEKEINQMLRFDNQTILAIDDNLENLRILQMRLESYGLSVFTVDSSDKALDFLSEQQMDMIFVDMKMPKVSGLETLNRIRELNLANNTPIIAMSAYTLGVDRNKIKENGFSGFISIPIIREELENILKSELQYQTSNIKETKNLYKDKFFLENKNPEQLKALIQLLEEKGAYYLKKLERIRPKGVVNAFSDFLIDLGLKYRVKEVENYGLMIKNALKSFNVEQEKELIESFNAFVSNLKASINDQ